MADNISLDEDQRKSHENLLLHLLATREKLMMVDPNSLTLEAAYKMERRGVQGWSCYQCCPRGSS